MHNVYIMCTQWHVSDSDWDEAASTSIQLTSPNNLDLCMCLCFSQTSPVITYTMPYTSGTKCPRCGRQSLPVCKQEVITARTETRPRVCGLLSSVPSLSGILWLVCIILVWGRCEPSIDAKRLYDDLLRRSGYNRLIRPVGNTSDTLTVWLGLRLTQIIDVVGVYT